jgi:CheY-like chemotaxis protein
MKVLLIEDDDEFVTALVEIVSEKALAVKVKVAKSRNSAEEYIKSEFFDVIILDLNIPTLDNYLDQAPVHGHSVFASIRMKLPGAPIIILTGSSGEDFIISMLEHSEKANIWGNGSIQLVSFHRKHSLDTFPDLFGAYSSQIESLSVIELQRNNLKLSDEEDRLVRIFSKKLGAVRCSIMQIGGGLSGSRVLRLKLTNSGGGAIHDVICKLSSTQVIKDEGERYNRHISRLPPEATPRKLEVIEHGAGNGCGVFYGLAEGFTRNAFDIVSDLEEHQSVFIKNLSDLMQKWTSHVEGQSNIGDIRRKFLSDQKFLEVQSILKSSWIEGFEKQNIQTKRGSAHGDLHGLNVLVSNDGVPILIDYGDVDEGPASIDPITLEFSLFFHPNGPLRNCEWPSIDIAKKWGIIDQYLVGCPCPEFILSCRKWATKIAAGDREIAAVAYSYLIRQLKYPEVNRDRVEALLHGVKELYDQT